jgi:protein TIF31
MLYAVQEYDAALKYLSSAHALHIRYTGRHSLKAAMLSHLIARAHSARGDFRTALLHEKDTYSIYRQSVCLQRALCAHRAYTVGRRARENA